MSEKEQSGAPLNWFKSSYSSDQGQCVEAARLPDGGMAVRHSLDPDGPQISYTRAEWDAFLAGVGDGEFNL